jgi:hypothetical protein
MNWDTIDTLLDKYWNCETSTEEEKVLKDFFSGNDVPEELRQYVPLFAYIEEEQSITLSADFDKKLNAAMGKADKKKYITIRLFTPLLRIAASILLIMGLGISVFFISRQNNKPYFTETYQDPNAAIKQATYALEKLSHALRVSEEASLQTIQFIDELDIDWSSLDSLRIDDTNEMEMINKDNGL